MHPHLCHTRNQSTSHVYVCYIIGSKPRKSYLCKYNVRSVLLSVIKGDYILSNLLVINIKSSML
jgi:hypothetical protein